MDFLAHTAQEWTENEESFLKELEESNVWEEIPLLNVNEVHNLKDGSLVRFRGMIQDMHSPEYYLEKFEVVNQKTNEKFFKNGKYRDCTILNDDERINLESSQNVTSERQTYVVISIPAINSWAQVVEEKKYKLPVSTPMLVNSTKRTYDEAMDSEEAEPSTSKNEVQKKPCPEGKDTPESSSQIVSKEHILNFPLPDRTGKTCHLKIYRNSDQLKLNDMFEFVGFLALNPFSEVEQENKDLDNEMEIETLHPPTSLVPRMHCVCFKKITHNNPLLCAADDTMDLNKIKFIRGELLIVLTQLLLGDELAAEYLILHLISEVYLRRDFMALGKFSLNILGAPKFNDVDFVAELYKFIEEFVPKSHYLPMTLENMNELSFVPKKDYECNRLTSGILQLSNNTHVVLDETKLTAGKLNAAGVNSVKAISSVIKHQKVTYDFSYYPLEFDCDIPFLIVSEGKSMINIDTHVVLKPETVCLETFEDILKAAKHFLKPELLNDIRKYLTLARLSEYEICDDVESLVQNEFVNMRQKGAITADDLHNLLVLARLVSISMGESTLSEYSWKRACRLEEDRKARLR